ncbi:hypothetical protein, partial [Pseudomonas sp. EL_65y_Pfl1_R83]|uniref:hypothetical protein n=1 Tax=Pseudomonas sp. EL_65y_Pfl1_R83 TaxID=3088697 RepID=UPI0030DBB954
ILAANERDHRKGALVGVDRDDHREEVADLMIATVDSYAPGFAASVLGRQIRRPAGWRSPPS